MKTHMRWITSFPVLRVIIKKKREAVNRNFFDCVRPPGRREGHFIARLTINKTAPLTVGPLTHKFSTHIHAPGMFDPKEVSQLAIVLAIVNHKIGALSFLQRANVVTSSQ